mmetsp:Transcript_32138/g.44818  ORF Transcript_32138/g.44818 Transcript_32138/m.44818 type:complete len:210 (+) Transcript_32138:239-868(+)
MSADYEISFKEELREHSGSTTMNVVESIHDSMVHCERRCTETVHNNESVGMVGNHRVNSFSLNATNLNDFLWALHSRKAHSFTHIRCMVQLELGVLPTIVSKDKVLLGELDAASLVGSQLNKTDLVTVVFRVREENHVTMRQSSIFSSDKNGIADGDVLNSFLLSTLESKHGGSRKTDIIIIIPPIIFNHTISRQVNPSCSSISHSVLC